MSNEIVVTPTTTSPAFAPVARPKASAIVTALRCSIITPFGRPVDPLVNNTYARSLLLLLVVADEEGAADDDTRCSTPTPTEEPPPKQQQQSSR
mmetsp:Transcript_9834/g.32016  ORF Transcript_9834/g.32016 Transcript_9834/m.32016 type:complete len:94 (+) Transcript_9834:911-1192(+)